MFLAHGGRVGDFIRQRVLVALQNTRLAVLRKRQQLLLLLTLFLLLSGFHFCR